VRPDSLIPRPHLSTKSGQAHRGAAPARAQFSPTRRPGSVWWRNPSKIGSMLGGTENREFVTDSVPTNRDDHKLSLLRRG
jgi:hypothetical protein